MIVVNGNRLLGRSRHADCRYGGNGNGNSGKCTGFEKFPAAQMREPERERDSFVSFSLEVFMAGYFLNSRPVCLFDRVAAVNGDSLTDTRLAAGRHSQSTARATSSGRLGLRFDNSSISAFRASGSLSVIVSSIGVWIMPGHAALILIPFAAYSRAALFVRPITPCFNV